MPKTSPADIVDAAILDSTVRGARLDEPLTLRALTIPNRVWMSAMCQYSAGSDGVPTDWHLVHYGSRAVGGVGLVMVESTAVGAQHRITTGDLGMWTEDQVVAHRKITEFIGASGAVSGVQLQAAGRKGASMVPWEQNGQNSQISVDDGGWPVIAPSPIAYGDLASPREMDVTDIDELVVAFARAAELADRAGYDLVEIHAAHGYLLHQFLSPLTNQRDDEYGGTLENRMRLPLRVAAVVRRVFPAQKPVFLRLTATDWIDGGIDIDEAVEFGRQLAGIGIDLLDVTSGALERNAEYPKRPGLNVEFSRVIADATGLPTAPVQGIDDFELVTDILASGDAQAVIIGRALLRDPYFYFRLNQSDPKQIWPKQYRRAF
ncbi:NADH:flavin oxidoreductase/NADH oxidase [Cryobacterium sp. Y50]|uniref:NADH:flavin oxidoreductase/NADH oxidase n=1 Tax=Cryobacterium sp. Y50 TaxID=2048286 RepID=UPI000CE4660E|nr:NADH:flavin oxidoreductase/NADH oxidase [Cryobacterium sp. Y50]